jgi:ribosomal protein S18 acetylase RimI-like enzyme
VKIPINIRTFVYPEDYVPVVELWGDSGPGIRVGRSDTHEEIAKKLQRDPDLFLVAELDGEIIGAVLGGFDGRRGMIYHLSVSEEHRHLGIGTALMDALEIRLCEKGCLRAYLLIRKDNPVSQFYAKHEWQNLDLFIFGKDLQ